MNDPWDVKSVRLGNQYHSCMKINGVPLLPPLLSKECRKEMQYYKLLAKEVEKRISLLKPYIVDSDTDISDDKTDAPDFTECEDPLEEKVESAINLMADKTSAKENEEEKSRESPTANKYKKKHSDVQDAQIIIDLNVKIEEDKRVYSAVHRSPRNSPEPDEIPERDCDYKKQKEIITDLDSEQEELIASIINCDLDMISDKRDFIPLHTDGPSSISSKSFTGSLNDIHADVSKQSQSPRLIRQRSYTVLNPSPQLLAHLEVQSINTGLDLSSISMSESMTQLNHSYKKRKSWDLESAKVKWSSMAMELKTKNIVTRSNGTIHSDVPKSLVKKSSQVSHMTKSSSLTQDRRRKISPTRTLKSENGQRPRHVQNSPTVVNSGRGAVKETPSPTNTTIAKSSPKSGSSKKEENSIRTVALVSESDDPAARVRELYEKLQKQQMMQMANLMEKQKREQQLLQQVFEEQNNILFKQLKTVCPKASIEVKQAWGDLKEDHGRGPVSLSQLINSSTPEHSVPNSPVSKTLTDSTSYIIKCDSMLKKSRELTNNIRKQTPKSRTTNGVGVRQKAIEQPPRFQEESSTNQSPVRRNQSPVKRNQSPVARHQSPVRHSSRRLNYETSASSEVDPTLTDRTNDTMADLNVTFPSDNSDCLSYSNSTATRTSRKIYATRACSPMSPRVPEPKHTSSKRSTEGAIRNLEENIQSSINGNRPPGKQSIIHRQPNAKELVAATKIVACAKGFLVRRLMRTERVQATVQTIRDALLCALQLHQDREGIRGADVDLHRRLIQQITAACYTLHDTFVSSSPSERCALIAADRSRRLALATKQPTPRAERRELREDIMSQSHSGSFPSRSNSKRPSSVNLMTQSNYETFSSERPRSRYMPTARRVPWR